MYIYIYICLKLLQNEKDIFTASIFIANDQLVWTKMASVVTHLFVWKTTRKLPIPLASILTAATLNLQSDYHAYCVLQGRGILDFTLIQPHSVFMKP